MINIILFGQMGSGKDTIAEYLAEKLSSEVIKLGKSVREDADFHALMNNTNKNKRQIYQEYGQGMRQIFGKDFWNINLFETIQFDLAIGKTFVIADGRQKSELDYWTERGFIPVGIEASKQIRLKRIKDRDGYDQSVGLNHETEISAHNMIQHIKTLEPSRKAFTIVNNSTINDLHQQIDCMVSDIYMAKSWASSL